MKFPELRQLKENTVYMLRNWCRWHRRSFLYLAARIPALVAVPMLMAYAPKVIMDCVTAHAPVSTLVLRVALLSAGIAAASWIAPFMQQKLIGSSQILRMRYAVLSFRKTMTADFVDVESLAGRERLERSQTFVNGSYSGAQDFCEVVCMLAQSIFGIISSVALLSELPALMLFLIVAACACEFLLFRLEYRADRKSRDERNRLLVKFSYFYRTSHEFAAGKDIRLYGLGDWFIKITADVLRTYTRVIGRYLGVSFSVSASRALVSAARDGIAYFFLISAVLNGSASVSDFIFLFGIVTGFSGYVTMLTNSTTSSSAVPWNVRNSANMWKAPSAGRYLFLPCRKQTAIRWNFATCISAIGMPKKRPSAGCPSRSRRAKISPSSAKTARAKRPPSSCCARCMRPLPAKCS